MSATVLAARPIGVFDSGVGGLTVLRALCLEMPREQFLYLGDTARLPYGTKSAETVVRYAVQAADALVERGVKALIVACNTASAVALPAMRQRYENLPVIGVVEPGAEAAVAASRSGRIAVIGTEATVRGGAYQQAIAERRPEARVTAVPCQLFVALAEEGWTHGPVAHAAAERYLRPLFGAAVGAERSEGASRDCDTLVLACTHFPMLLAVIREVVGAQVSIVDSAATTARSTRVQLQARGLLRLGAGTGVGAGAETSGWPRFLATDGVARFAAIGSRFLEREIAAAAVELVDL